MRLRGVIRAQYRLEVLVPESAGHNAVSQRGKNSEPRGVERIPVDADVENIDVKNPVSSYLLLGLRVRIVRVARRQVFDAQIVETHEGGGEQQRADARYELLGEGGRRGARNVLRGAARGELDVGDEQTEGFDLLALALRVLVFFVAGGRRKVGGALDVFFFEDFGADAADGAGVAEAHDGGAIAMREAACVDADAAELLCCAVVGAEGSFGSF